MVDDFNRNFKYCPYYFFIDSNVEKIANGDFKGVLLNKDLAVMDKKQLPDSNDTTHFILYYGQVQPNNKQWKTRRNDITNSDFFVDGPLMIVAMDYKFHQLPSGLPYKPRFKLSGKDKKELTGYRHTSNYSDLNYNPQAIFYSATLSRFYRKHKHKITH